MIGPIGHRCCRHCYSSSHLIISSCCMDLRESDLFVFGLLAEPSVNPLCEVLVFRSSTITKHHMISYEFNQIAYGSLEGIKLVLLYIAYTLLFCLINMRY
ncbi:hypothetical protein HanRHA438_Chr14g0662211 [Helianthus annuus]|nr:hypothetical protein HanRHA438_Chr14g0662211 [Helianthus annuus]